MDSAVPDDRDLIAPLLFARQGMPTEICLSDGRVLHFEQVREAGGEGEARCLEVIGPSTEKLPLIDIALIKDADSGDLLWETPAGKLEFTPSAPNNIEKVLALAMLVLLAFVGANFLGGWGLLSGFDRQVLFGALFLGIVFVRFLPGVRQRT
ncbi:MAG: hypothetical protein BGO57_05960 [Sphingomonadales bacterium 63-6]|nr:MAG: hypothetical protein BGO57_05960 [Sphingomonadales bacterium 63-6]